MYAIVSLLDEKHHLQLENLWRELEADCRLAGISLTPLPHFSWHIASEYDFKRLEPALTELAASVPRFWVRAAGLGVFTGASPVLYVPVIKDAALAAFHRQLWELAHPLAVGGSAYYAPDSWVPHITLAYGDVEPDKLGCAMEKLAFRSIQWEIEVQQLALVYTLPGQVGKLQTKFALGG